MATNPSPKVASMSRFNDLVSGGLKYKGRHTNRGKHVANFDLPVCMRQTDDTLPPDLRNGGSDSIPFAHAPKISSERPISLPESPIFPHSAR
jgi:hypothetical protein